MAGYDPALMEQARLAMGYAPLPASNTLTPEEAAFAQGLNAQPAQVPAFTQLPAVPESQPLSAQEVEFARNAALQRDVENAQALQGGQSHAALAPMGQTGMQPPLSLDWQPNQPAASGPSPAARGGLREPPASPAQAAQSAGRPAPAFEAMKSPARNPLAAMEADASGRRTAAANARDAAGLEGDIAFEGQVLAQEELGGIRQRVAEQTGANRKLAAEADIETQRRLDDEYDSHMKATDKITARKREADDYIANYQVKDRRRVDQKAMGALAVFASYMMDHQNMIAGLNMGQPIVTNRGAQMADMIGRQIDRDLEEQREMLANKRTQAAAIGTELGQARERWGDTRETLLTAKQLKLDQYEKALEGIKAQGASAEATILADQGIEALRMQKAQLEEERARGDYDKAYAEEQRLKIARAQQAAAAAAARRPPTTKEALELEGKALDNAKKRQDLTQGPQTKLTAEQQKRQSLFKGKSDAANTIARAVAGGEAAPGVIARNVPGVFRSDEGEQLDTAIAAFEDVLLRDESGASISEGDKASKRAAWGLDRGEAARRRGLRMMLDEYNARLESVGLPPVAPIVRRGAAR